MARGGVNKLADQEAADAAPQKKGVNKGMARKRHGRKHRRK